MFEPYEVNALITDEVIDATLGLSFDFDNVFIHTHSEIEKAIVIYVAEQSGYSTSGISPYSWASHPYVGVRPEEGYLNAWGANHILPDVIEFSDFWNDLILNEKFKEDELKSLF